MFCLFSFGVTEVMIIYSIFPIQFCITDAYLLIIIIIYFFSDGSHVYDITMYITLPIKQLPFSGHSITEVTSSILIIF